MSVGVSVGVTVSVGVRVGVDVSVGVTVGVGVSVGVAVGVSVGVGVASLRSTKGKYACGVNSMGWAIRQPWHAPSTTPPPATAARFRNSRLVTVCIRLLRSNWPISFYG